MHVPYRTSKEITGLEKPRTSSRYEYTLPLAPCWNCGGECCDRMTRVGLVKGIKGNLETVRKILQAGPIAVFFKAPDFARNLARSRKSRICYENPPCFSNEVMRQNVLINNEA